MPGREARAACNSSMSAARSVTASSTRSFCRLPEPAAELGQRRPALRAADVFLHQPDLRGRHVELRVGRGTPAPGALRPARSSPAVSGRGSGRCRGRRGPPGRLRAVRGSCRSPGSAGGARGAADRSGGTARRCSAARSRSGTSRKPLCSEPMGKCSRPCWAACVRAENVAPAAGPRPRSGRRQTLLARPPASSNSSRTRLMSPLKRSTDSIFSRQVVSSEPVATAEAVTDGKAETHCACRTRRKRNRSGTGPLVPVASDRLPRSTLHVLPPLLL